jgi:hypothetical protein
MGLLRGQRQWNDTAARQGLASKNEKPAVWSIQRRLFVIVGSYLRRPSFWISAV